MSPTTSSHPLNWKQIALFSTTAVASFHLAYNFSRLSFIITVFLFCLFRLADVGTPRKAFYIGLTIGFAIYAPELGFFWNIFNGAAIALWAVLAFWIALFLLLSNLTIKKFGHKNFAVVAPFFWTALEYFRGELYYLRFSWLNIGYVFSHHPEIIKWLGVYGVGFILMAAIAWLSLLRPKLSRIFSIALILLLVAITNTSILKSNSPASSANSVFVAGIQMEFPPEIGVTSALDKVTKTFPEADLLVLSEYTIDGPVPEKVKNWCKTNQKYLVIGAKDPLPDGNYSNTAFVIGPGGEILFSQVKSVPIQFFKDGLPATEQKLWNSPWGKIGLCICYDLSYRRVTDELIRQGAQAIIVPTMDVVDWGRYQHELHARVAPVRATEYGIPIFRVASSGISQLVNAQGKVEASAPFPGEDAMLGGKMDLRNHGRRPLDSWLAPLSLILTALVVLSIGFASFRTRKQTTP